MGTRADFYIGRGQDAQWIGSIAWDGYPDGITPRLEEKEILWPGDSPRHKDGKWEDGKHLFEATAEEEFVERLTRFMQFRDDVSLPENGWPWPWDDSNTTDYAYAFDGGKVYASCFGSDWFDPGKEYTDEEWEEMGKSAEFPNMKDKQNVVFGGDRSGLIVMTVSAT